MPFSRSISAAAARFGQQSANIAQTSTANINQIMLGIANMRAQGIMEGSRTWANALQQLGVTAQNYPMIKRQMEEYDYQKQRRAIMDPMQEELTRSQIDWNKARAADEQAQAEERRNKSLALTIYSQVGNNPNEVAATVKSLEMQGRGIEPLVAQIHQTSQEKIQNELNRLLTLSKGQRDAEIANNAEIRRVTGVLKITLDDPAATDTEKQLAYQAAAKRLAEIKPSLDLGNTIDATALTNINLAHNFSISLEELEKQLQPPEPSERMKREKEGIAQWYADNPDQPKNAKTDRMARKALALQQASESGTAVERAIIREKGRYPTAEEIKAATAYEDWKTQNPDAPISEWFAASRATDPESQDLRRQEIELRKRAIEIEEAKLARGGGETPEQAARKAAIIMNMANMYERQGSTTPQVDAENWYDKVSKQSAKLNVTAPLPPEAAAKLKEGILTRFANGQEWTLEGGKPKQIK